MIRALALIALLAGCDTPDSSPLAATEKAPAAPQPPKDSIQPRCFEPYTLGTRDGFLMCNIYEYIVRTA